MTATRSLAAALLAAALLWGAAACGHAATPAQPPRTTAPVLPAVAPAAAPAATPAKETPPAAPSGPPPAIPILMYHVIAAPPADAPYPGLYVTPATFAAQMAALHAAGYHALTMQQAYDIWRGKAAAPAHPIVLSFDNGYTSQFTRAVPILKGYGWPGVLNLVVDRLNIPDGLTTGQIRTMIADGWEVDDQTLSHPELTILSPQELAAQTVGAAERIRSTFGVPARFFCYPSGDYDAAVIAALRRAGFLAAVTVWPGFALPSVQGALTLDRVRVSYRETAAGLMRSLRYFAAQKPAPPPAEYPLPRVRPPVRAAATASATAGAGAATASATATAIASGSAKTATASATSLPAATASATASATGR